MNVGIAYARPTAQIWRSLTIAEGAPVRRGSPMPAAGAPAMPAAPRDRAKARRSSGMRAAMLCAPSKGPCARSATRSEDQRPARPSRSTPSTVSRGASDETKASPMPRARMKRMAPSTTFLSCPMSS